MHEENNCYALGYESSFIYSDKWKHGERKVVGIECLLKATFCVSLATAVAHTETFAIHVYKPLSSQYMSTVVVLKLKNVQAS